ncbi:MAG: hypothetical protein M1418_02525 [Deltaproteobacteria bacterium]|nr:hypothetical protein [Deltaproteobacteria bacterium]
MRHLQRAAGILALLFLVGCAAAPPAERKREVRSEPVVKPAERVAAAPLVVEDFDLLSEGIALLSRPDRPDPTKARSVFASLLERHPRSRWRSAAETFIRLIDEAETSLRRNRQEHLLLEKAQSEQNRLLKENDQLRKMIRELTERLQGETAALLQENDQLKKDLQRLKLLEIELQKRERMLR